MSGKVEKSLSDKLKKKITGVREITKLAGDASSREYYRIISEKASFVAMVYPKADNGGIARVRKFTEVYRNGGLSVPDITDQIGDNILIQEDVGDISLQKYLLKASENDLVEVKRGICLILEKLKKIQPSRTESVMDIKTSNIFRQP